MIRRRPLALALALAAALAARAQTPPATSAFDQGKADARALLPGAQRSARAPVLADVPNYQGTNVPEASLRSRGAAAVEDLGRARLPTDPVGRHVQQAAAQRPRYSIDPRTDPLTRREQIIAADPARIAGAVTGTYSGCTTTTLPTTPASWTEERCTAWNRPVHRTCRRTLDVQVTTQPGDCGKTFRRARVAGPGPAFHVVFEDWNRYFGYRKSVDPVFGPLQSIEVVCAGGATALRFRFGNILIGGRWQDRLVAVHPPASGTLTGIEWYIPGWGYGALPAKASLAATCDASGLCRIRIVADEEPTPGFRQRLVYTFVYRPRRIVTTDTWQDGCKTLADEASAGRCALTAPERCVTPNETRTIAGVAVTRECWTYETEYTCASAATEEEPYCAELRRRGCSQIDSECTMPLPGGACGEYEQTYRCPQGQPATQTIANCGGRLFCIDGKCTETGWTPSPDFALAASYLSGVEAAAREFDPNTNEIFRGKAHKCSKSRLLGSTYRNCCGSKAWLQRIGLARCGGESRTLAELRAAGRCHYVGSYKSGSFFHKKKHYVYCCFGSKLGRILQEQIRAQIGMGWGSPRAPSCGGLTPEQITRADWERIDLSEWYADLQTQPGGPSTGEMRARLERTIRRLVGTSGTGSGTGGGAP